MTGCYPHSEVDEGKSKWGECGFVAKRNGCLRKWQQRRESKDTGQRRLIKETWPINSL